MKEYLNKETHEFVRSHSELNDMWVEIPEGANIITKLSNSVVGNIYFHWKAFDSDEFWLKDEKIWSNNFGESLNDYIKENNAVIIWERENKQTIASAIESVNDKVASAEIARQESKEQDFGDYAFAESDALIESSVEQSSIVETLAERQSTYGDFSKVAEMTQGLLFVMSQYGYSDMPDTHKESIHMIASKLARIVNGDNNHLDSWHDIGGYSKLIENLIKSDDDNS